MLYYGICYGWLILVCGKYGLISMLFLVCFSESIVVMEILEKEFFLFWIISML